MKRNGCKSGVTMVETLVAVTLLSTTIAGAAKLVVATRHLADVARDESTKMQIIKNRIEHMSMSDFSTLELWQQQDVLIGENGYPDSNGRFLLTSTLTRTTTNLAKVVISVDTKSRSTLDYSGSPLQVTTFLTEM